MGELYHLGIVRHPAQRPRSWIVNTTDPLVINLEKLFLISKNNPGIQALFTLPSGLRIGSQIEKDKKATINGLIGSTSLSKVSVINTLKRMIAINLIRKKTGKPNFYFPLDTLKAQLFFKLCVDLINLWGTKKNRALPVPELIKKIKNDDSVLILIHFGSSSRATADKFSDVDLFAVTRDKISRGEFLSRYSQKNIDLSVYSKGGFLKLITSQPDFLANIATAKILKGKDIFEAVLQ
jgi:hypothetical protein